MGIWDTEEHYWGEEDDPLEEWTKLIIARGSGPMFEMEQVLPGEYDDDPINDPICSLKIEQTKNGDYRIKRYITLILMLLNSVT
jgi:hypothetical protein